MGFRIDKPAKPFSSFDRARYCGMKEQESPLGNEVSIPDSSDIPSFENILASGQVRHKVSLFLRTVNLIK
jgi:hypothetical protein